MKSLKMNLSMNLWIFLFSGSLPPSSLFHLPFLRKDL